MDLATERQAYVFVVGLAVVRVLVLHHSDWRSTYGASTSLRNHLSALSIYKDISFGVFDRWNLVPRQYPSRAAPANVEMLKRVWMPINSKFFDHQSPGVIKSSLDESLPNAIAKVHRKWVVEEVRKFNPDVIHLNSIVLLPFIRMFRNELGADIKFVLHIRELAAHVDSDVAAAIHEIHQIVCIDRSVYRRAVSVYGTLNPERINIIQNPFCSPSVTDPALARMISRGSLVFCVAGLIGEDKGIDLICKAFLQAPLPDAVLLIIGRRNEYYRLLNRKYNDRRIAWLGEIQDFSTRGGFRNVDFLIRGEREFCTGRTVYEALYSGADVILPGGTDDLSCDSDLSSFADHVTLYRPRDVDALSASMVSASRSRIKDRSQHVENQTSNFLMYAAKFRHVYEVAKS